MQPNCALPTCQGPRYSLFSRILLLSHLASPFLIYLNSVLGVRQPRLQMYLITVMIILATNTTTAQFVVLFPFLHLPTILKRRTRSNSAPLVCQPWANLLEASRLLTCMMVMGLVRCVRIWLITAILLYVDVDHFQLLIKLSILSISYYLWIVALNSYFIILPLCFY